MQPRQQISAPVRAIALDRGSGTSSGVRQTMAGVLFGLWLAVVPVKFGNPVLFEHKLSAPSDVYEFLLASWPIAWSYGGLAIVALAAGLVWRWKRGPHAWLLALPLA